jgi:hypothetical protein
MSKFLVEWWDMSAFIILAAIHIGSWVELKRSGKLKRKVQDEERRSGAQMMTASSAAGVTAVSILVPASMLIVQLSSNSTSFPVGVLSQVFRGALWFLLSLLLGLIVIFLVPLRSHRTDVRKSLETGIPFGLQLLCLFLGMARLVTGLYHFLLAKGG